MENPNLNLVHFITHCTFLGRVNPYVNIFVRVANRFVTNLAKEVHICIIAGLTSGNEDVHRYNIPTTNEVAMIILGESEEVGNRDVIIQ
jgi:hypothetical protein